MQPQTQTNTPEGLSADDVITLVARLAQVMAESTDLLRAGEIDAMKPFEDEKVRLVTVLEKQKAYLKQHPEISGGYTPEQQQSLKDVFQVMEHVRDEHYRELMLAKEINGKVMEAIAECVDEAQRDARYQFNGAGNPPFEPPASVTLNKKV